MSLETITVGLRFDPRDAGALLRHAQWCEANGHTHEDITLFALAAKAANDRDALRVECGDPDEAQRLAEGFVARVGITRPAIEPLN